MRMRRCGGAGILYTHSAYLSSQRSHFRKWNYFIEVIVRMNQLLLLACCEFLWGKMRKHAPRINYSSLFGLRKRCWAIGFPDTILDFLVLLLWNSPLFSLYWNKLHYLQTSLLNRHSKEAWEDSMTNSSSRDEEIQSGQWDWSSKSDDIQMQRAEQRGPSQTPHANGHECVNCAAHVDSTEQLLSEWKRNCSILQYSKQYTEQWCVCVCTYCLTRWGQRHYPTLWAILVIRPSGSTGT